MVKNQSQEKKLQIMERRKFVSEKFLLGWSQRDIAEKCGVTQPTVCNDITFLIGEWKESNLVDLDAKIELEIRRINHLEGHAWTAFFESKKIKTTSVNRQVNRKAEKKRNDTDHFDDTSVTTIESAGDAKFMNIISDCIKMRVKLMGLDAPQKVAMTDTKGNDIDYKEKSQIAIGALANVIRQLEEERIRVEEAKEPKGSE